MKSIKRIILAFRPKTLTAAFVPCFSATALCIALKINPDWKIFVYAIAAAFFIQIGTNLVNDAIDFKKGADTEKRMGPQRITQAGILLPKTVMLLASLFFLFALLLGIPLVIHGGPPILWIGIISVLMGYAYTAGPFPLAYLGLGDLFVIIFFGIIAVMGMFFLHTSQWSFDAFILGLQTGFHATVLIAINNLRDMDTDKLVNKKTLPVRFGKVFARCEIATMTLLPFFLNVYWLAKDFYLPVLLSLLTLPLAFIIIKNVLKTEPSEKYNLFLAQSASLHLFFGLLLSLGFFFL